MRKFPKGVKGVELTIGIIFSFILICIIVAPFTLPSGTVVDLSGKVGSVDNQQQIQRLDPFAQVVYYFGDVNCHQIAERSYYLNGNEMPICSRDLGIVSGLIITLFALAYFGLRPKFLLIIIFAMPMAIDGGLQAVTHYTSFNELRMVTGLLAGAAAAMFLGYIAHMAMDPEPAS